MANNSNGAAQAAPVGFVLFVAYIGAAVYFIQQNHSFLGIVMGLLKAAVWPAYVMYEVLRLLGV